jgi:hypothetical protein
MTCMITTIDNPFNPFDNFDEWYAYDESKGYYTCEYLARVARTSDELTYKQQDEAITQAIDEIIEFHPDGFYKKIEKSSKK